MDNNVFPNLQGMGSANFMEMQQRMQRELMSNPDTLRQVIISILTGLEQTYTFALFTRTFVWLASSLMSNPLSQVLDNPVTQSLMSNPDVIRQMLESNPQMQEVFLKMFFFPA